MAQSAPRSTQMKFMLGAAIIFSLFYQYFYQKSVIGMSTAPKFNRARFEVFGRVQGVFFRKHTKQTATKLGIAGWVRNTPNDTVEGECEGSESAMKQFKYWLKHVGSPRSSIEKCEFSEETVSNTPKFASGEFKVVH